MVNLLILSSVLILLLLFLNAFIDHLCGFSTSGQFGSVLEGTLTICILYLVIISMFGRDFLVLGIPFADRLDAGSSLTELFHNDMGAFALECAELIALTFVISLISRYIPSSFGGSGTTGTVIRTLVLVAVGVVANHYLLEVVRQTVFFSWATTALQCFFSGTALVLTPAMMIGSLLNLNPDNGFVNFLVNRLPQTRIGAAISTATTNSLLLVGAVLIFESQFGSISAVMNLGYTVLTLLGPVIISFIGLRLMVRTVSR